MYAICAMHNLHEYLYYTGRIKSSAMAKYLIICAFYEKIYSGSKLARIYQLNSCLVASIVYFGYFIWKFE